MLKVIVLAVGLAFTIGCQTPYTGSTLTVDDVNRYLDDIGKDTVCLQDGFDSICIKVIPGPKGDTGVKGIKGDKGDKGEKGFGGKDGAIKTMYIYKYIVPAVEKQVIPVYIGLPLTSDMVVIEPEPKEITITSNETGGEIVIVPSDTEKETTITITPIPELSLEPESEVETIDAENTGNKYFLYVEDNSNGKIGYGIAGENDLDFIWGISDEDKEKIKALEIGETVQVDIKIGDRVIGKKKFKAEKFDNGEDAFQASLEFDEEID